MKKFIFVLLFLVLGVPLVMAKNTGKVKSPSTLNIHYETSGFFNDRDLYPVQQTGAFLRNGTTYLAYYQFEGAGSCDAQGWTSVDITTQTDNYYFPTAGNYFVITDFWVGSGSFNRLYPIEGSQSLWCGIYPVAFEPWSAYLALPGYGNNWDQAYCSPVFYTADTMVTVDYYVQWDSEPGYDWTVLEYTEYPGGAYVAEPSINGGAGRYEGVGGPIFESINIAAATGMLALRFHFRSDGAWSDEDGLWDTDGAVIIDSLTVRDSSGILVPTETFEPPLLVNSENGYNWYTCPPPGYGDLAMLVNSNPTTFQNDPVEEDPCASNFSCLWLFVNNSTANYGCNTPNASGQQAAVPYVNSRDQYIMNEIWSPWIDWTDGGTASGASANIEFDVYRDLELDALVFYVWHVRSRIGAGSPSLWSDRSSMYYGGGKDWFRAVQPVGDLVQPGATEVQIALGVVDMCRYWCGLVGSGACHSHAPMFDNVKLYRVTTQGPQFSIRDIDMIQDNFSSDGTVTGTCRADMAQDILPAASGGIMPGDSARVQVNDPEVGLGGDPVNGGPAVYCFISVDPTNYAALAMQATETRSGAGYPGDLRYPWAGTVVSAGRTWEYFRMDSVFANDGSLVQDQYCIDFNDNLFVPGDTCWFFFGATGSTGIWTYVSLPAGQDNSMNLVAQLPDEFTMLPAVGGEPGCDILYVDGMNFRGAQPFFDTAFQSMPTGIGTSLLDNVDRYDIRGPDSGVGNRPGSRVRDVLTQLIPVYNKIIWNTGDMSRGCIGDGVGYEKSDDATMLFYFCDFHNSLYSGIYFSGDDLASEWSTLTSPGAISLTAYMAYAVVNPDHVAAGAGVNPAVVDVAAGAVFPPTDSLIAYGGCPIINDFDVIAPASPLTSAEMDYARYTGSGAPGPRVPSAILAQTTINTSCNWVRIVLSGFSYHYIRDINTDGIPDRYTHMYRILAWLGNVIDEPVAAFPNARVNSLAQNYPNPFNPVTTIKYTIKEKAHVSLKVYNVAGQLVKTLVDEVQSPEAVTPVEWRGLNNNGQQAASGVYFYKLVTKDFTKTRKLVLLK